jgi:hypothetical protein
MSRWKVDRQQPALLITAATPEQTLAVPWQMLAGKHVMRSWTSKPTLDNLVRAVPLSVSEKECIQRNKELAHYDGGHKDQ